MNALLATFVMMLAALTGLPTDFVASQFVPLFPCLRDKWERGADGECRRRLSVLRVAEGVEVATGKLRETPVLPGDDSWHRVLPAARLFSPRILLAPIGAAVTGLEEVDAVERLVGLFYNDRHTIAWVPFFGYQSDFGPAVGAMAEHKDLFRHDERLRASVRFFGQWTQRYELRLRADRLLGTRVWMDNRVRWEESPGLLFAGIGADADDDGRAVPPPGEETYYAQRRGLGILSGGWTIGPPHGPIAQPGIRAIYNNRKFSANPGRSDLASVTDEYDTGQIPGFEDGVETVEIGAVGRLDLRKRRGLERRGVRADLFYGEVFGLSRHEYSHFGGEGVWNVGLGHPARLIVFRTMWEGVLGEIDAIPFSELPRLGGADRLRGHHTDRYRDRHAALVSTQVDYPLTSHVSGSVFIDVGTVARVPADVVGPGDWKAGAGGGIHLGTPDSVVFRLDIAGGDGLHIYATTDLARAFDERDEQL